MIKDNKLRFPRNRSKMGKPVKIVIHHPVAFWTLERLHRYFINSINYNGIGYNYYIQQNLNAFYGRSDPDQEYIGAHALDHNHNTIGVAIEGDFDNNRMSDKLLDFTIDVVTELCRKHDLKASDIIPHKAIGETACPGRHFRFEELVQGVRKKLGGGESTMLLRNGSKGTPVKKLQEPLKEMGFYTGKIDGAFGPLTENSVRSFQETHALQVDGIAGPETLGKISEIRTEEPRGLYKVQTGAFANRENADRLAKELQDKGYDTYITVD